MTTYDGKYSMAAHVEMTETDQTHQKDSFPPIDELWLHREKKLVRRLDLTLMLMVWVLYLFNYLDRNNIA